MAEATNKIRHPRCWEVFIERRNYGKWIAHTGISLYVPGEFNTQEDAIMAVDEKLHRNAAAAGRI